MHWIETGSVSVSDLGEAVEESLLSREGAKTVVVFEPKLDPSLARRFIKKELREDAVINTATNTDPRLLSWTDSARESAKVLGFWGDGGLTDVAEEISKLGYDWVYFLVLADGGTRLVYESYCTYLPGYLEMD